MATNYLVGRGEPLYTVLMENSAATRDGYFVAREFELRPDDGFAEILG